MRGVLTLLRDKIQQAVNELPEEMLLQIAKLIDAMINSSGEGQRLADGSRRFIPYDDEPLTFEEVKSIEEAKQELADGKTLSLNEFKVMYGL